MILADRLADLVDHLAEEPYLWGSNKLGPGRPHISSDKVVQVIDLRIRYGSPMGR